jgi:hypothetical protein
MTTKNGKPIQIDRGTAGVPRIYHLEFHRACDRFLAKRGIGTAPVGRRNNWLFGKAAK